MAPSKRSSNTQQTAKSSSSGARHAPSARERAGAAGRSPSSQTARPAARTAPQPVPAAPPERHPGMLDEGARRDIAGVVIAVVGVALLVAVLTPTSGVLTQAVSEGLHAVLGVGAFLLPAALLLWALTFFVRVPQLVPSRVAAGLALIALAALGIAGLCTPGCEADPSRLFNAYVLADRGGYVGNGLAWLLLTLTGRIVGLVALAGMALAGLIVIGFNARRAVQELAVRVRQRGASRRARMEEQRAPRVAGPQPAWNQQDGMPPAGSLPRNWAPTALFDPSRPLSQPDGAWGAGVQAGFASHPGAVQPGYDQRTAMLDPSSMPTSLIPGAGHAYSFGCGNTPGGVQQQPSGERPASEAVAGAPAAFAPPAPEVPSTAAPYGADRRPASSPASVAAPAPVSEDAESGEAGEGGDLPPVSAGFDHPAALEAVEQRDAARTRRESRRARTASTWWDPADDWNRDDFDPAGRFSDEDGDGGAFVPGVLPGAPVSVDDVPGLGEEPDPGCSPDTGDEAPAPTPRAAHDPAFAAPDADEGAATRASDRTSAAFVAASPVPRARQAAPSGGSRVELPWEPARVGAPADGAAVHACAEEAGGFVLPDPSIMQRSERGIERSPEQRREAQEMAVLLDRTLAEFGVKAKVVDWVEGPTCTTYEVSPGEGVRVSKFTNLEDDIARALARTSVRIYAPVPGTSYVGIEVPNTTRQTVYFGDVLPYVDGGPLDFAVGLDANGNPVHVDLAKLPHLLVAGTTGSGKSVCVNSIVMSFLMRDTPDDLRLIMVDPKQVEFKDYDGIPHLIMPVITDMRQAAAALQWGVTEMDRRYRIFSNIGVRDLKGYNRLVEAGTFEGSEFPLQRLPSIVVVIDELADLMMVAKKDVEASIVRIAQLGRACGIHLVMATQAPRADVVTGLIRANVACRIGLKVAKGTDSTVAIDQTGAEKLLGNGDMLFLQTAWGDKPRRIQGCWLSDNEIAQVVEHLKSQTGARSNYQMAPLPGQQLTADLSFDAPSGASGDHAGGGSDDDPLAWEAAQLVVENQLGSTSMIQRRLKLGYARAGRVMDMLEEMGVVGPARGSKPRDVLIHDLDELATLRGGLDGEEGGY